MPDRCATSPQNAGNSTRKRPENGAAADPTEALSALGMCEYAVRTLEAKAAAERTHAYQYAAEIDGFCGELRDLLDSLGALRADACQWPSGDQRDYTRRVLALMRDWYERRMS